MAASRDDIFQRALALQDSDRAELVGALIRSLDTESEEGVEAAWREEVERRGNELETGAVQAIPWEAVREQLLRARSG
jgi:putative addiction module component (TIGR02574 family)